MTGFAAFPKVPRLSREMVVTEKLDGTNASVWIVESPEHDYIDIDMLPHVVAWSGYHAILAGSRKRFVQPEGVGPKGCDNFGFAAWVCDNAEELVKLGEGTHYGEWWGKGIQRGYDLDERRFSLFNVGRWAPWESTHNPYIDTDGLDQCPPCCHVVPVLWRGLFNTEHIDYVLRLMQGNGSSAAPGYKNAEGIMVYHAAARQMFKKTVEGDEAGKGT